MYSYKQYYNNNRVHRRLFDIKGVNETKYETKYITNHNNNSSKLKFNQTGSVSSKARILALKYNTRNSSCVDWPMKHHKKTPAKEKCYSLHVGGKRGISLMRCPETPEQKIAKMYYVGWYYKFIIVF